MGRPLLGLDRNWEDVVGDEKEKLACCLPRMGQNGRECCPSHRYFSWSKKLRSLAGSQVVGSGVCVCLGTPPRGSNDDGGGARGAIARVILGTTREPEQGLATTIHIHTAASGPDHKWRSGWLQSGNHDLAEGTSKLQRGSAQGHFWLVIGAGVEGTLLVIGLPEAPMVDVEGIASMGLPRLRESLSGGPGQGPSSQGARVPGVGQEAM